MTFALPTRLATPKGTPHLADEEFMACYPALGQVLGASLDAKGAFRQGATLTVFADEGALKAVLRDRHERMALFLTLDPAKDMWQQVEAYLTAHPDRWREDKDPKK